MTEKRWLKWLPLVFLGFGLLVVAALEITRPDPMEATISWGETAVADGITYHQVTWSESGVQQVAWAVIPEEYRDADTVPIHVPEGTATDITGEISPVVTVADGSGRYIFYGLILLISLLLGTTTLMGLRGFGYVPGTGQVSETPDLKVTESEGFYWRY